MSDEPNELMDAEFLVEKADSPTDEQALLSAVTVIEGIAEARVAHCRVDLRYDPTTITKAEIGQRIEAAGFRINEVHTAQSSPVADAILPGEDEASPPV